MPRTLLLSAICMLCAAASYAQVDTQLDPANDPGWFVPLDMGSGETFYVTTRSYGFDSTNVELMHCDAQQNVIVSTSYKLANPLTFLNTAAKLNDGILAAGGNLGFTYFGFVLKTDLQGALDWYVHFDGLDHGQDQLVQLNTIGNDFSLYTYPGGTYRDGFYRFEGNSLAGPTGGVVIETSVDTEVRIYETLPTTADPTIHLVAGEGYGNNQSTTKNVLLADVGPGGANWMKFIDMGAQGSNQIEQVTDMITTADGNYLLTGLLSTSGGVDGFVMKVDLQGTVLWAKQYTDPNGSFLLTFAYELANGDLLIGGRDQSLLGALLRVDAIGAVIWQKQYQATGAVGVLGLTDVYENDQGEMRIQAGGGRQLVIDQNGEGCDLISVTPVSVSTKSPSTSTVLYANTTVSPNTYDPVFATRTPVHTWINSCIPNSVPEFIAANTLIAYPQPTSGLIRLSGNLRQGEAIEVRSINGQLLRTLSYDNGLDLSDLAPGMYVLRLPRLMQSLRVSLQ